MVMLSERRLAANRRNAAGSTGPRTPGDKAVAALNAMRHGLLSRGALAGGESEADRGGEPAATVPDAEEVEASAAGAGEAA